ncbi:unnamed protein product [Amoebophrya sp. A120]|nr:unnamed protein product [Amoebophrya sp. A120]|eukprot:GSA120T00022305001.1
MMANQGFDPAKQGQPVMMQPMQPGQQIPMEQMQMGQQQPMMMQPMGQPGMMVGPPVMASGTPMGAPMMQGGMMMAPMGPAQLEWERPRVCAECTCECCLAGCCPCISVSQTMTLAKMGGAHALIVGICVFLQYFFDGFRNYPSETDMWRLIKLIAWLLNMAAGICESLALINWKQATGRHVNVRDPSGNCGEDFCCFCCCPCYAIPAVHRTVEDWMRMGGPNMQQGGTGARMAVSPGGMMQMQQQ